MEESPRRIAHPSDIFDDMASILSSKAKAAEEESRPVTPFKRAMRFISNIAFFAACIALVAGSIMFNASSDPHKSYLGYRPYNVITQSMTPKSDGSSPPGGFRQGDLIVIKMCKPEDIQVGDIITFNPSSGDSENTLYLTHRVIEVLSELGGKEGTFFITKGDANNSADPPISGEMLIGKKVFSIPKAGSLLQSIRERPTWTISTVVCLFGLIIALRWFFAIPKSKKQNIVQDWSFNPYNPPTRNGVL